MVRGVQRSSTQTVYENSASATLALSLCGSGTDGNRRSTRRGDRRGGPATTGYDYANFVSKAEKYDTDAWVTQAEFARDALGRRIEKVANSVTHRYYFDGVRAIEETEGTGTLTVERQYVFGNGIDEALILFDKNGETYDAYYYLSDPLWTVEALLDEDAAIIEAYAYTAYGAPTIKAGDGGDGDWFDGDETTSSTSAYANSILFTGREWNPQIALYHYRARFYNPVSGRFLQRDPIGYKDGMNLYNAYFVPMSTDALGLFFCYDKCHRLDYIKNVKVASFDLKYSMSDVSPGTVAGLQGVIDAMQLAADYLGRLPNVPIETSLPNEIIDAIENAVASLGVESDRLGTLSIWVDVTYERCERVPCLFGCRLDFVDKVHSYRCLAKGESDWTVQGFRLPEGVQEIVQALPGCYTAALASVK